jgi:thioredoxin 1
MKRQPNVRQFIISRLKTGRTVGEGADLAAYPDSGYFVVGLLPEGPLDIRGLTPEQSRELADDGELSEYLETPAEAADLYLKWKKEYEAARARQRSRPLSPATGLPPEAAGSATRKRASSRLRNFDGANFHQGVLASPDPVLVFFGPPASASGRLLLPLLERLAADYPWIQFGRVQAGPNDPLAVIYGVVSLPTCLLFEHGRLVQTFKGLPPERALRAGLDGLEG